MSRKIRPHSRTMFVIATSVLVTLVVGLIVVNLTLGDKSVKRDIPHLYGTDDPQFLRTMGVMLGPAIVPGNQVSTLRNGREIFPAMLEAIGSARQTITFETFIYWSGDIGMQFAQALAERARAGVKVHVMLDWVGSSRMDEEQLRVMEQSGVQVRKYRPLRWYNLGRFNNRTHRKLLIVDGKIGFTGGVGIAPQWTGNASDPNHWRDTHFRIEGPVVAQMQSAFLDNWVETTGAVLHGAEYFPALQAAGPASGQVFSSSPSTGSQSMALMYMLAITAAKRSIDLSSSYFVPDELVRAAMIQAVTRGVKIRIIVPGQYIDTETVRRASRGQWGDLLQAGVEIFEYQPTMYHCKVMVVDGLMTSVGSTNFDDRSFRHNDESNLNIYDADFAREQMAIFEQDLQRARRITYQEWKNRPLWEKLVEHTLALAAPLL